MRGAVDVWMAAGFVEPAAQLLSAGALREGCGHPGLDHAGAARCEPAQGPASPPTRPRSCTPTCPQGRRPGHRLPSRPIRTAGQSAAPALSRCVDGLGGARCLHRDRLASSLAQPLCTAHTSIAGRGVDALEKVPKQIHMAEQWWGTVSSLTTPRGLPEAVRYRTRGHCWMQMDPCVQSTDRGSPFSARAECLEVIMMAL